MPSPATPTPTIRVSRADNETVIGYRVVGVDDEIRIPGVVWQAIATGIRAEELIGSSGEGWAPVGPYLGRILFADDEVQIVFGYLHLTTVRLPRPVWGVLVAAVRTGALDRLPRASDPESVDKTLSQAGS
ncbi:conserved hypothetical protein [Frankia sp. AiPs1]|uniref:hypothetical protein n=1 Tax=Frankia sp. AiPa1 TaxID=573492 RepID=UPI00202B81DF|nr:hypothetical protein [Frankia sp. AiPa1]MCL9761351.1 hypothetical protein [Frankia sp. AiPa1]